MVSSCPPPRPPPPPAVVCWITSQIVARGEEHRKEATDCNTSCCWQSSKKRCLEVIWAMKLKLPLLLLLHVTALGGSQPNGVLFFVSCVIFYVIIRSSFFIILPFYERVSNINHLHDTTRSLRSIKLMLMPLQEFKDNGVIIMR